MTELSPGEAALRYLAYGWSVVPVRPREKRPMVRWEAYQTKPPSTDRVKQWFEEHPDANVGIITGSISGLIVVDVDLGHGGDESLAELEKRHGSLPETVESLTGGGGRHIYFRHPGGTVHNRVGLAPGIDLRADGGLVVAPPSLHPSGRKYYWEVSHHPDDIPLAPLPPWLLRMATDRGTHAHSLKHWRSLSREGVSQGERNSTLASFVGHLLWHGVDREVVQELMLCWNQTRCRPPLPDQEVLGIVDSINRLHVQELARRKF